MPILRVPIPFYRFALLACFVALSSATVAAPVTDRIVVRKAHALCTFDPSIALGFGLDGHEKGDNARIYTPDSVAAMKSAGFGALTYRLRTELGVEAWHWNDAGAWSDPVNRCGYWTSSAVAPLPDVSFGYRLPRRGSTIDQANNDGYSRIDDGDSSTFWKSNPYLDHRYTGESDTVHPQWVCVDLGRTRWIDTVNIDWGAVYATQFRVEVWRHEDGDVDPDELPDTVYDGRWQTLASIDSGPFAPAVPTVSFTSTSARYIRILMLRSSGGSRGGPDQAGYAVRELSVGATVNGVFTDYIVHAADHARQTKIAVSSTDPWHCDQDMDRHVEQPGFGTIAASGLAGDQPILMPVPVLYDTPENAAAELRALRANNIPVAEVELGEEPDGQLCSPEDYGALYIRFADALKAVAPAIRLGGPSLQTDIAGWRYWPDAHGERSWIKRFVNYLASHGHLADLSFFSFEWYPFDDILGNPTEPLMSQPGLVRSCLDAANLPKGVPLYVSEYGYSAFAGEPEVTVAGAIMNTDIALSLLAAGVKRAYFYGAEPAGLIREIEGANSYGNLALFIKNGDGSIAYSLATFQAAKLLTQQWANPGGGAHCMIAATAFTPANHADLELTPYAVVRPDGQTALLLLNKDPSRAHIVTLSGAFAPTSPLTEWQYSSQQYVWHANSAHGFPSPNLPPAQTTLPPATSTVTLPPLSITLLRGR